MAIGIWDVIHDLGLAGIGALIGGKYALNVAAFNAREQKQTEYVRLTAKLLEQIGTDFYKSSYDLRVRSLRRANELMPPADWSQELKNDNKKMFEEAGPRRNIISELMKTYSRAIIIAETPIAVEIRAFIDMCIKADQEAADMKRAEFEITFNETGQRQMHILQMIAETLQRAHTKS